MKVSAVIPAYNEEQSIAACLEALLHQTDPVDEIIVVDNNSTDKTVEIAKKYPVRVITEKRQGVVHTRNTGFDAATGDIIGRVDVDTLVTPTWVASLKKIFNENSELQAVSGPTYYHDMPLKRVSQEGDLLARKLAMKGLRAYKFLWGANMALRREAWQQVRDKVCNDPTIHEDVDLAIHLAQENLKVDLAKELLSSTSSRRLEDNGKKFREYMKMLPRTFERHDVPGELTANIMMYFLLMVHPALQLTRRLYDPETQQLSLKKLLAAAANPERRKNPMADHDEEEKEKEKII